MDLPEWAAVWNELTLEIHDTCDDDTLHLNDSSGNNLYYIHTVLFRDSIITIVEKLTLKYNFISTSAQTSIVNSILNASFAVSFRSLELFLEHYRSYHSSESTTLLDERTATKGLASDLLKGGLKRAIAHYPVLARLIGQTVLLYINATCEMLSRFENDRDKIQATFCGSGSSGEYRIAEVAFLGDFHAHGKATTKLILSNGCTIFYKPYSLHIYKQWQEFSRLIMTWSPQFVTKSPLVIDSENYGWVENLRDTDIPTDMTAYLEKLGSLLCVLHFLGTTDAHIDNIVVHDGIPCLIDLETLMTPAFSTSLHSLTQRIQTEFQTRIRSTVLSIGLLPNWIKISHDTDIEVGCIPFNLTSLLSDSSVSPDATPSHAEMAAILLQSFSETYKSLHSNLSTPQCIASICSIFNNTPIRVVLRGTSVYRALLERSTLPQYLSDGIQWERSFDILEEIDGTPLRRHSPEIREREKFWMSQLSIPRFYTLTQSHDLFDDHGLVNHSVLEASCLDRIKHSRSAWNKSNLRLQIRAIKAVIDIPHRKSIKAQPKPTNSFSSSEDLNRSNKACIIKFMNKTINYLDRSALHWNNTRIWPCFIQSNGGDFRNIGMMDNDLYSGVCGVAMSYAAHFVASGKLSSRTKALECLTEIRMLSSDKSWVAEYANNSGVGGVSGLLGIAWTLSTLSTLLSEPSLLVNADSIIANADQEFLTTVVPNDFVDGLAGAILCILSVYRVNRSSTLLALAHSLGNQLISRQRTDGAWTSSHSLVPLTGLAHGVSGIILALAILESYLGYPIYRESIQKGLRYERMSFSSVHMNWPDYRSDPPKFLSQWCHGAAGIGLARLALPDFYRDAETDVDIRTAINACVSIGRHSIDSLCCGSMGCLEFLDRAGRYFADDSLRIEINHRVSELSQFGQFRINSTMGFRDVSLFCGLGGGVYGLAKLLCPNSLPSVLTLGY